MEGSPSDTPASTEKKGEGKDGKKTEKAVGLGKSSFEFANKKDKAEKIAEAQWWEKLIPKEGEKPKVETDKGDDKAEKTDSLFKPETAHESGEEADDPSLENLSRDEIAEVAKPIAAEELKQRQAERDATTDEATIAELDPTIDHLEKVAAGEVPISVETVEDSPDSDDEDATAEADTATAPEASAEDKPVEGEEPEVAEQVPEQADGPAEFEHGQELVFNAEEEDPAQQAASTTTPPPVNPPQPQPQPGPNTNANQPPPPPNQPPTPPPGPPGPNNPNQPGNTFNVYNLNAPPVNPNAAPVTIENYYQENTGAYFLAGGILGYLLGRRRGRIKTEKKMRSVTKKLEKQIDSVRQEVLRQEALVREQARQRYNEAHQARGTETTAARTLDRSRKAETLTELTGGEVATNQQRAAERLGVSNAEVTATAERVQHLDHREVLAIAEKVVIDGTSLRTIYESKQITEPGLRRITREFLRGGDIKAALKAEIQVKEMQYERDPQMRDRLAASYADVDAAGQQSSKEALEHLLAQGIVPKTPTHATSEQAEAAEEAKAAAKTKRGQQALVAAWAVLVVVLVIAAILLATR